MSDRVPASLVALPIELVYRILDNMDELTMLGSARNVCARLNAITDTYHRYQVKLIFIIGSDFYDLQYFIYLKKRLL